MKFFSLMLAALFLLLGVNVHATQGSKIQWHDDYQAALTESKSTKKPLLLVFTGTGWCTYCKKLEQEVFSTSQFAKAAGDQYVFVKMEYDYRGIPLAKQFQKQHQELSRQYNIQSYPTVIIVNSEEQILLTTGYRAGGGERYAAYLQSTYAKSSY